MTVFWLVAALFIAGALLMIVPPLWRSGSATVLTGQVNAAVHRDHLREAERDLQAGLITPERLEQLRRETERRVLEDAVDERTPTSAAARRTAVVVALLVPAAAVLFYLQVGDPRATAPAISAGDRHATSPDRMQAMVTALAERLKADPNNAEGWLTLGRSYTALGRYRDGATALRRASELMPGNANVLADLADVTGMAQGKRLAGEPARIIQQALDVDPKHVKALALAGTVAFEARDYEMARGYWSRLIAEVPPDSPIARQIRGSITEATRLEGLPAGAVPALASSGASAAVAAATPKPAAAPAQPLRVQVQLSPELAARVQPGDTLFVFARAAQGPRMPLAIVRQPVPRLPASFELDDSMAMAPNLRLSAFDKVVVGVRISRSGNATPQSGDLVAESAPVASNAQQLKLVVDRVTP